MQRLKISPRSNLRGLGVLSALTPSLSRSRERVLTRKGAKHVLSQVEGAAKEKAREQVSSNGGNFISIHRPQC